ncbi:MAG: hypothetical protein HRT36_03330 [Alphaproteobacteria bacterium]|nr:hypothetical protein [Alphaproteobacteria bacterium]
MGSLEDLIVSYVATGMSLPLMVLDRQRYWCISSTCLTYPIHRHRHQFAKLYGMFALIDESCVHTALWQGHYLDSKTLMYS